ncbi:recombinase family protein [Methylobacterium fujisawaense]|uniref:recombinase family protein n=1 Tax=Methylobacterium fujisawaense TaxID=107400 RepID=UPI00313EA6AC
MTDHVDAEPIFEEYAHDAWASVLNAVEPPGSVALPEPEGGRTAAIYVRRSISDDQHRSTGRQVTRAVAHCRTHGLSIDLDRNLFVDRNRSGSTRIGRKGLADMLAAAKEGRFKTLVVDSICRVARRVVDALTIVDELEAFGVELHVSGAGQQTEEELALLALQAQIDRIDLRTRLQTSLRQSAADGRLIGSRARYGYRAVQQGTDLAIDEVEASIVRRCFAALVRGVGKTDLARELNAEGIPAPGGGIWSPSTFMKKQGDGLLQSALYKGVYEWGRRSSDPVTILRPDLAIVSPEQYDAVNRRPEHRRTRRARCSPMRLLKRVKCSCGATMWVSNSRSYRCRASRYASGCRNTGLVRVGELERAALLFLHDDILSPDRLHFWHDVRMRDWSRRREATGIQRQGLEQQLEAVDAEIGDLENGPDASDPHAIEQMGYLEFVYHTIAHDLAALDLPPPEPSIDSAEAEQLRDGVLRLLRRLPDGLRTEDDISLAARLREFLPCIVVGAEIDGERPLELLVGIPGCPEGKEYGADASEERWVSRRMRETAGRRMRYPEAVLRRHADAEGGSFRPTDAEWRRVKHLFTPFADICADTRLLAESLICMATTGLTPLELPERYQDIADVWNRNRVPDLWVQFLRRLGPRRKLLDTGLNRRRFQASGRFGKDGN